MPSKVVVCLTAFVSFERSRRIHEGIVVDMHVCGVKHSHALIAPNEDIAGYGSTARDLEEEAVVGALDPVVYDHPIAIADVVPHAIRVRLIDDQVVAESDSARL